MRGDRVIRGRGFVDGDGADVSINRARLLERARRGDALLR